MSHKLLLRRSDGKIYLERHGISTRWGGIYVHKMTAPDPGPDPHDHPWWFLSWVLVGGYTEKRASTREPDKWRLVKRRWLSFKAMRLDECHQIVHLAAPTVWTVVLKGVRRRRWGFYVDGGWLPAKEYDHLMGERRELKEEIG